LEATDKKNLYNDFSHLAGLDRVTYHIDNRGTQFIELNHPDNFLIQITVPDKILEWFICVSDNKGAELVRDWDDGYDEPIEVLKAERQKIVEDTVQNLMTHQLRFLSIEKRFSVTSMIQIFIDNEWQELFSNSRLKLW
jgi:hypothetical protein